MQNLDVSEADKQVPQRLSIEVQQANFRLKRFRQGVAALATSKMLAIGLQLLAIPIAIKSLGSQQYAAYIGLVAASLLPSVFLLRMGPAFTSKIAALKRGEKWGELAEVAQSAIVLSLGNALLAISAGTLFLLLARSKSVIDLGVQNSAALFCVMSLVSILGGVLAVLETIQVGLHETRWLGVQASISNIIAILVLCIYFPSHANLWTFFFAMQIIPFVLRLLNAAVMLRLHSPLFRRPKAKLTMAKELAGPAIRYTAVAGVGNYASLQFPILAFSAFGPEAISVAFVVSMQVVMQCIRGLGVVLGPLVPAVSDMVASKDYLSARRQYFRLLLLCNLLGAGGTAAWLAASFALVGSFEVPQSSLSAMFFSAGLFTWGMILESGLSSWIFAVGSTTEVNFTYRTALVRSFFACLAVILCLLFNLSVGGMFAMAICVFLSSVRSLLRCGHMTLIPLVRSTVEHKPIEAT